MSKNCGYYGERKMNYNEYQLTKKETKSVWLLSFFLMAIVAWLFYRSVWAIVLFPFFYQKVKKKLKQLGKEKRDAEFLEAFLNGMRTLNSALQAGLSMERAFREVERETKILYREDSYFYQEMVELNHSVDMNISIEKLFLEFANRTGMEDIIQFAEVLEYGKRSGGNWKQIIDSTVYRMNEKCEVRKQIEVMIAEKKLEQEVMNILPLGILCFLQMASWEYMSVLYHNWFGVMMMTIVLVLYLFALYVSEKIMQIRI